MVFSDGFDSFRLKRLKLAREQMSFQSQIPCLKGE